MTTNQPLSAKFLFVFNSTRFSRGHVLQWILFIVEKEVQKIPLVIVPGDNSFITPLDPPTTGPPSTSTTSATASSIPPGDIKFNPNVSLASDDEDSLSKLLK